ncbi:ABC transporter substrate-binding protein [Marinomonas spartinae]|uniref:ABC transporter substrate-binding protein n=1 Tax=Marinomonas spartinae TaxID=1792290 RepID=UPI0018F2488E|nr:sugar ABC transporter substrate-binding protein [Marinomonas spartinae]MBJ7556113.1 sugar ABC transporter substrate-binding protein [Marinomonas spartinae]
MKYFAKTALVIATSCAATMLATDALADTVLTVATVNNGQMIQMQKLTPEFEKANPGIKIKWVTLPETQLRQNLTQDIANKSGLYDIMTIGMYNTPIWAKRGWLSPINTSGKYDVKDLIPSIRQGLSYKDKLYGAPFYGESSMVMYRKDLVEKAGMKITDRDKWTHIEKVAKAINDPKKGIYGICLRGKAGWGANVALVTTIVNSFGGRWFDMKWHPQIDTPEWKKAVTFYVNMLRKYGPPGATSDNFNQDLALFEQGKCGIWVDATIAASFVSNPTESKVADKVAFAQAPYEVTKKGSNWLWSWALAIPVTSKHQADAQKFVRWATSKGYIKLVAKHYGWASVPTGTRESTYANPNFQKAAVFAKAEFTAIKSANPDDSTLKPVPYKGVQFVSIPEFQSIGTITGQMISAALAGKMSVDQALENAQKIAERQMRASGYY